MSDVIAERTEQNSYFSSSVSEVLIGKNSILSLSEVNLLTKYNLPVKLRTDSYSAIEDSFQLLLSHVDKRIPIYGINTHFGDQVNLLDINLKSPDINAYYGSITNRQENLIRSHSCGLGEITSPQIVRLAMILRTHCISQGFSGVSPSTINYLIQFINSGITPIVRRYGSIGASGDLIPLAMIASAVIGENVDVLYQNEIMRSSIALEKAGLKKLSPQLRDGLAMINGTSFMTAVAAISFYKLQRLFHQMIKAIAMTLESMLVITSAYNPLVHQLKKHTGSISINQMLLKFWEDSQLLSDLDELRADHQNSMAVQDYYSLRSVCQGFGSFFENLSKGATWIEEEMNSINDNPIIDVAANKIYHNANFMGYYITEACDLLKMDIAQASTWIHALLAILVHPRKNKNLPTNLVNEPGKQNGFRPIQLLAASLAVQNRKLAQTHQAFMLPTEGDNQDVNSLGTHAAFDFCEAVDNLERLTAILLMASTQALEFRDIEKASSSARETYHVMRQECLPVADCRPLTEDMEAIIRLMQAEKI